MPSRKNRPGKFGCDIKKEAAHGPSDLVDKLKAQETKNPGASHYVGWPDMAEADRLVSGNYLTEDPSTRGCFYITSKFRSVYGS